MLAKINSFKMRYGFVNQILDVHKLNAVALKMMMMSNSHWHILEKCKILLTLGYRHQQRL